MLLFPCIFVYFIESQNKRTYQIKMKFSDFLLVSKKKRCEEPKRAGKIVYEDNNPIILMHGNSCGHQGR